HRRVEQTGRQALAAFGLRDDEADDRPDRNLVEVRWNARARRTPVVVARGASPPADGAPVAVGEEAGRRIPVGLDQVVEPVARRALVAEGAVLAPDPPIQAAARL